MTSRFAGWTKGTSTPVKGARRSTISRNDEFVPDSFRPLSVEQANGAAAAAAATAASSAGGRKDDDDHEVEVCRWLGSSAATASSVRGESRDE